MTPDALERIEASRARKKEAEEARRLEAAADIDAGNAWRRNTLARYVAEVLARSGRERLAFFEKHPPASIFR